MTGFNVTTANRSIAAAVPKGPVLDIKMPPYHYQRSEFGSGLAIQRSKP